MLMPWLLCTDGNHGNFTHSREVQFQLSCKFRFKHFRWYHWYLIIFCNTPKFCYEFNPYYLLGNCGRLMGYCQGDVRHPHFQLSLVARVSRTFTLYCMVMVSGMTNLRFWVKISVILNSKWSTPKLLKKHILSSFLKFVSYC